MIEALLLLTLTLASLALLRLQPRVSEGFAATRDALFRAEIVQAESLRLLKAEQQLAEMQRLTEAAVSGSTEVVRAVHKGIAAIPFSILECIPATRDTTRVVRITHDLISDAVYGSIGAVNRGVGARLREGMPSQRLPQRPQDTTQDAPPAPAITPAVTVDAPAELPRLPPP